MGKKISINCVAFTFLFIILNANLYKTSKWNVLFCVLIFGISIGLILFTQMKDIPLHVFAFVAILLLGLLSIFIQPICNIPDENTHLARAEYLSEGHFFVEKEAQEFDSILSIHELINNVGVTFPSTDFTDKNIDYTADKFWHIAASNISLLYIPQAIGVSLAKILHLKVIWLLWLGRFFNLLAYTCLISIGIKIAPNLKNMLLFVALLPMSIQQAASLSPDALINGVAIFTVGVFIWLSKKSCITWLQFVIFWGLCVLITVSKLNNICFGGLILLLPEVKGETKSKFLLLRFLSILLIGLVGCFYYYCTLQIAPGLYNQEYLIQNNVSSSEQIRFIFSNFGYWIKSYLYSLIKQLPEHIELLNNFGWFEISCPVITIVMIFLFAKLCYSQKSEVPFWKRWYIILLVMGIYFITSFALYLGWTFVGATRTVGVQGRYFIPAITLMVLLFDSECKSDSGDEKIRFVQIYKYDIWVMIMMASYYLFALVGFYYQ